MDFRKNLLSCISQFPVFSCIGNTPLYPLKRIGADLPVKILVKCENLNPTSSIKDRIAIAMIKDAIEKNKITPGHTIVEATAGNTGISLALITNVLGLKLTCVIPEKMSVTKRKMLVAMGAEVIIVKNVGEDDPESFISIAKRIAGERDGFQPDQFNNTINIDAHYYGTGPEIWQQTQGEIAALVTGCGSGGTLTGAGRFLKEKNKKIQVVLADPVGSSIAALISNKSNWIKKKSFVDGVGWGCLPFLLDRNLIDSSFYIEDSESFSMTRRLALEEGLLVGGSAGMIVSAAVQLAKTTNLPGPIVAILPDSWDRYFDNIYDDAWKPACL